jgi:hypothetical protein
MARAIEAIERDLGAIEESVKAIASELHTAYTSYLKCLGQSVQQQLISVTYNICTQGYPESFLQLSFSQRQQVQKALRRLVKQTQEQLLSHLEVARGEEGEGEREREEGEREEGEREEGETGEAGGVREAFSTPHSTLHTPHFQQHSTLNTSNNTQHSPHKPEELMKWQKELEGAIAQTLETLSQKTNRLLQQAGILPQNISTSILEAAKNELSTEAIDNSPNLLNLLVENNNPPELPESIVLQIVALNLRVSDIEFNDHRVMSERNQIRPLLSRLNAMGAEYQKKQRERVIVEAQAAWRRSWDEE